ncbi:MAG: adenosine kinase [Planctomycetota bacterium]
MSNKKFDVFGVGNALVDILAFVADDFIAGNQLNRGSMTLMNSEAQSRILQGLELKNLKLASGGSAANTMVAIAQSGGTGIYTGKVARDTYGEFYRRDMEAAGIRFEVEPAPEASLGTGTCVVLTTPDTERTMCTHLGISTWLTLDDIDVFKLAQCQISYIEGYLWDADLPRAACVKAFEESRKHQVRTAFTFSDSFLIDRFHADFRNLLKNHCDIVFCNADEARKFYGNDSLEACIRHLGQDVPLGFVTNSADGCYVVEAGQVTHVPGFSVKPIDSVGAGDAFAGGTLYGLTHGYAPATAARWGNYLAAQVVATVGPRHPGPLSEQAAKILQG